ncbi:MAG: hypothetical protein Q7R39_04620 [Dehalococcoidia bacterium]|nr:hypothetical protein [Dehalococcoidia bacterium]
MAVRSSAVVLGTFVRTGVLCLPSGRSCLAHGLPEAPDSLSFVPLFTAVAATCLNLCYIECWDSAGVTFINSSALSTPGYLRLAVEHSFIK